MKLASTSTEEIGLITSILLLLVLARLFGELMNRIKQAPVVGEILAGVILGPAVLGLVYPSAQLEGIAELSVFLILLSAGLEMDFKQVMKAFIGPAAILAGFSFLIPLLAGLGLGVVFSLGATGSIVLALVMAITALPVIVRILANFQLLESKLSQYAIATAIFNDIASLFLLGVILGLGSALSGISFAQLWESASQTGSRLGLFALIILTVYLSLTLAGEKAGIIQGVLTRMMRLFGKEALFGLVILFVLIIGAMSEWLSSHFVIGVFFGGLLISQDVIGKKLFRNLEDTLNSITSGFLAPIFFAYIGLKFSWEPLKTFSGLLFALSIIVVSVLAKVLSARLGGRWAKLPPHEALGVGIVLNSRGTMDLVVAKIALDGALITESVFSSLVLLGIVSTAVTPILFSTLGLKGNSSNPTSPPVGGTSSNESLGSKSEPSTKNSSD